MMTELAAALKSELNEQVSLPLTPALTLLPAFTLHPSPLSLHPSPSRHHACLSSRVRSSLAKRFLGFFAQCTAHPPASLHSSLLILHASVVSLRLSPFSLHPSHFDLHSWSFTLD
eukprot:1998552-Rhodomonas_salina.1